MYIGIAISSFINSEERKSIMLDSINNLMKKTNFNLTINNKKVKFIIYLVDDCSPITNQLDYIKNTYKKIRIHRKEENGGIAKCKNTCLRLLNQSRSKIFILLDDDTKFLSSNWWKPYCKYIYKYNIKHLICNLKNNNEYKKVKINKKKFRSHANTNGFALFYNKCVLKDCGYFKVPKEKWGYEHAWYSNKISKTYNIPAYLDIIENKNKFLTVSDSISTFDDNTKYKYSDINLEIFNEYETCPLIE